MKQIIQSFTKGETLLVEVPAPVLSAGHVIIKTTRSLVSSGTERMLVEFSKASLISKARQQPERVKEVLDKIKTEGLIPTLEAVFRKLDQPLPLGYCNVGRVIQVGKGISNLRMGDRVASNGCHAEYVCVPKHLVSLIPENVSDDEATFTVIGAIALQAVRLCNPSLGETIVIIGLGLIGLITADLLLMNGCKVIGIDPDLEKLKLAAKRGVIPVNPKMENVINAVIDQTNNLGADSVIITASSDSNEIISQAARYSRKRGRIILVGVIGLNIKRSDFYEKELTFQVSCSYGPGRYDDNYEINGQDYPAAFVRWTENRNFETILSAINNNKLDVKSLITKKVALENFKEIYDGLLTHKGIATILEYPSESNESNTVRIFPKREFKGKKVKIGIIGAGNFTQMTILPILKQLNAYIKVIGSRSGLSGSSLAKKYDIGESTTDYKSILQDPDVNVVIITTRHNLHASMVMESLNAGKHVFVEKPLAIREEEIEQIINSFPFDCSLTVGYNRRFSPHTLKVKQALGIDPINIVATMNAGMIPQKSWVQDINIGGGRIIGEACHYFDLMIYLTGSKISAVCATSLGLSTKENSDNVSILLKFENGSLGVINYFSNGSKTYDKERIDVYSNGRNFIIKNFKSTYGFGVTQFNKYKTRINKGHKEQFKALLKNIENGGESIIPFDEIINSAKASICAVNSLKMGSWISLNPDNLSHELNTN